MRTAIINGVLFFVAYLLAGEPDLFSRRFWFLTATLCAVILNNTIP